MLTLYDTVHVHVNNGSSIKMDQLYQVSVDLAPSAHTCTNTHQRFV